MSEDEYLACELREMELMKQRFFIDGLLPEGLSFIAGPPKFGKSYLNLQLAVSVASGEEFLGRSVLNPCNVLYLYLEGDAAQVKERLDNIYGEAKKLPRGLVFMHSVPSMSCGGLAVISNRVVKYDIGLVIIDTWQLVRDEAPLRGTAYQREYNELTSLRAEICGKLGVSVLLTHHTKQLAPGKHVDDLHMLNGSSALSGCADAVLMLTGTRGGNRYRLIAHGRSLEDTEIVLERTEPMGWKPAPMEGTELQDKLSAILHQNKGGVTVTDVKAMLPDAKVNSVWQQLNRWTSAGKLVKEGRVYRLP